jgi:hypothetical protein
MVDMTEEEVVDRTIPVSGELVPRGGIPPVGIEPPISEERKFGQDIELEQR